MEKSASEKFNQTVCEYLSMIDDLQPSILQTRLWLILVEPMVGPIIWLHVHKFSTATGIPPDRKNNLQPVLLQQALSQYHASSPGFKTSPRSNQYINPQWGHH
ncbi:hypothetical protein GOP47_0007831 [Adiantum capillus-veneris]|uniref:Uncharacterized protein n=1 Tax=Adiantum capillus-veneris TaxID=13818 RepID=A0A9D4ZLB7_ADICA|nr:hypothetical protein GOP47_0007831 [Adiantum capillus-veneris]